MVRRLASCVVLLAFLSPGQVPAADLSPAAERLVKHALLMAKKRQPSSYEEGRFERLLSEVPREDLLAASAALRAETEGRATLDRLAARIEGLYWEATYPGTSSLSGFAEGVASQDPKVRATVLRAVMTLEDLTAARRLAGESAKSEAPGIRLAAATALAGLLDLDQADDPSVAALLGLLRDEDPVVRCETARLLESSARPEVLDAYAVGLDVGTSRKVARADGSSETFCFGAQAFRRLAELSGRHDTVEYDAFRALPLERRAEVALDLTSWWEEARPTFSFHQTHWERFAAASIAHGKIVPVDRPTDAFFQFRSPVDASRVRLELKHLQFRETPDPWSWLVEWRLECGLGGKRNSFVSAEAKDVPVNLRHGVPKEGVAWLSLAAQRIGKDRARVVVRYSDFEAKRR